MQTFAQFLRNSLSEGHTNVIFEQGMYSLSEDLQNVVKIFEDANVAYELIGGVAVNAHLLAAGKRGRAFVTRDIDALLKREDLDRLVQTAKATGYEGKKIIGGFALLLPGQKLS